ncbi:hypothetical protein [Afifella pfennigii]|uniref:hypothetical protein n=1 Tax=Afifella pfennigii TaxID=209897 RepID=UPI00054DF228|nr:hypothetical protein [Afifella pfennigii]
MMRKLMTLAVLAAILLGGATIAAAQGQGNGGGGRGGGGPGNDGGSFARLNIGPLTHVRPRPNRPNRPNRRIRRVKQGEDCSCRVRRLFVNGRMQTVLDCYHLTRVNGVVKANVCAR